jgi:hypothetical protein
VAGAPGDGACAGGLVMRFLHWSTIGGLVALAALAAFAFTVSA